MGWRPWRKWLHGAASDGSDAPAGSETSDGADAEAPHDQTSESPRNVAGSSDQTSDPATEARQRRVQRKAERTRAKAERAQRRAEQAQQAALQRAAEHPEPSVSWDDETAHQMTGPEAQALADARFRSAVPIPLQIAGSWAWRLLVIAGAVALIGYLFVQLSVMTVPIGVALLLAAGLSPVAAKLRSWGLPSALAAALCLLGGLVLVLGVLSLIVAQVVDQSSELANSAVAGFEQFTSWISNSSLGISLDQLQRWQDQLIQAVTNWVQTSQARIAQVGVQAGGTIGSFLAGTAMTLFAVFFFLHDGRSIWNFVLRIVPRSGRRKADRAGVAGWESLVAYVKATVTVAAVDAFFPLVTGLIMGMNLAWAMAGLIFMGAFIPIVGVVLTGAIAILVTLVTVGPWQALVMLGVIIVVNQLESNFLQPMLLGRAVSLHPMAVLFAIAVGISVAGIIGGLLIIPILAFSKSFADALFEQRDGTLPAPRTS